MTKNKKDKDPELVNAIDQSGKIVLAGLPLDETLSKIKDEFKEKGESSIGVPVIHVWLARSNGHSVDPVFILQERSDNKRLDKTIGGHVSAGLSPDQTVRKEASEEMGGVPLKIVKGLGWQALNTVQLSDEAVVFHAGTNPWQISGRHDRTGEYYEKPSRTDTYLGLYDGNLERIQSDFEVNCFVEMPYSKIKREMTENPDRFTPDVQQLIDGVAAKFMNSEA